MISEFIYFGKTKVALLILALYACVVNVEDYPMHTREDSLTVVSDTTVSRIDSNLIEMKKTLYKARKCVNDLKKEYKKQND